MHVMVEWSIKRFAKLKNNQPNSSPSITIDRLKLNDRLISELNCLKVLSSTSLPQKDLLRRSGRREKKGPLQATLI